MIVRLNNGRPVHMGVRVLLTAMTAMAVCGVVGESPAVAAGSSDCVDSVSNGGFETPLITDLVESDIFFDPTDNFQPGGWFVWQGPSASWAVVASLPTTDTTLSQSMVWSATEGGVEIQKAVTPYAGNQYAEITGLDVNNTLYQSVATTPGQVMMWSLAHRSAGSTDVMEVQIGADLGSLVSVSATPDSGSGVDGRPSYISDGPAWRVWRGTYTVPDGQTSTTFAFKGISSGSGVAVGNYIDDISFTCDPNATDIAPDTGAAEVTADPSLASTGLTYAAMLAGMVTAVGLFVMAVTSFRARGRLREIAVDMRLAATLRALDARLRRIENSSRRR